jgi:hypothetical protein
VDLPIRAGASLGKSFQKTLTIKVVQENGFPPMAAIHSAVDRARILDAQFAGGGRRVAEEFQWSTAKCKNQELTAGTIMGDARAGAGAFMKITG